VPVDDEGREIRPPEAGDFDTAPTLNPPPQRLSVFLNGGSARSAGSDGSFLGVHK